MLHHQQAFPDRLLLHNPYKMRQFEEEGYYLY